VLKRFDDHDAGVGSRLVTVGPTDPVAPLPAEVEH